jgi:protein SCO1
MNTNEMKRSYSLRSASLCGFHPESPLRRIRLFLAAAALTLAFITGFFFVRLSPNQRAGETYYGEVLAPSMNAYDFHLTDQNGKPFSLSQLRGKVVLFAFGYTHCPDVCPTTLTDFTKILLALPEKDRTKVQLLFISLDPQRDRPDVLKEYISFFGSSVIGLTGDSGRLERTASAYGTAFTTTHPIADHPKVYFINHSSYAYLVSPSGRWQLRYFFEQLHSPDKVAADIERSLVGS